MASGIYQIQNRINHKRYIGSAVNVRKRWNEHLSGLRHNVHHNRRLQVAFEKHGEAAFRLSVLEHIEDSRQLIPREQHYLDTLKPEYNIAPVAGNTLGRPCSPETRAKMSKSHMGHRLSDETKQKLSNAHMGHSVSQETRQKISEAVSGERNAFYGKHLSDKTRAKLSMALSGERHPNYGKHLSAETRRKISEALTGKPHPHEGRRPGEETRRKMSEAHKGKRHSLEARAKMSKIHKARWRKIRTSRKALEGGVRTRYQHVHFVKVGQKPKTSVWTCRNNRSGGELGRVRWYGPWRQYCYFPVAQAVYSGGCLKDICSFLAQLAEERKRLAMDRMLEG